MKTIVVGTDFTPSSLNACKYAAMLAMKSNSQLVVFNLYDVPILHSNSGIYFIALDSEKDTSQTRMRKLVEFLTKNFPGLSAESFIRTGSFEKEIKKFIKKREVLAVVMGLATKTKLSKFIYGSHSTDIAGKLGVPVIIVPEIYRKHKIENVALSVSSGEKAKAFTLTSFADFLQEFSSNLQVVHIRTEDEVIQPQFGNVNVNGKKHKVEIAKAKEFEDGMRVFCRKNNTDLAAIISKKHSLFFNLFYETNTKKLAFASKIPVMAVHE